MRIKRTAIKFLKRSFSFENIYVIAPVITVTGILLCMFFLLGCSKNQDLKIIHNHNVKPYNLEDGRRHAYLDMYVYKKFKDIRGKESTLMYKVD